MASYRYHRGAGAISGQSRCSEIWIPPSHHCLGLKKKGLLYRSLRIKSKARCPNQDPRCSSLRSCSRDRVALFSTDSFVDVAEDLTPGRDKAVVELSRHLTLFGKGRYNGLPPAAVFSLAPPCWRRVLQSPTTRSRSQRRLAGLCSTPSQAWISDDDHMRADTELAKARAGVSAGPRQGYLPRSNPLIFSAPGV